MKERLADIAQISHGNHWNSGSEGEAMVLTGSNFNDLGKFAGNNLSFTHAQESYLLRDGDILLQNKGISRNVLLYKEEFGKAVASSMYFVIRSNTYAVLPYFLYTFLSSAPVQSLLLRSSEGTSTPSLRKSELENIEINLPDLYEQRQLCDLFVALKTDLELTDNLLQHKKQRNLSIINQIFNSYDR